MLELQHLSQHPNGKNSKWHQCQGRGIEDDQKTCDHLYNKIWDSRYHTLVVCLARQLRIKGNNLMTVMSGTKVGR